MRRAFVVLAAALLGIGLFTGGLAWLLSDPRPPAGASRGERLFYAYCIECHGRDGRGSWRAALFLLQPGNLAERVRGESDRYLFDVIKHGGAPIGRPGMPAFGYHLSDSDIEELVKYLRTLGTPGRSERPGRLVPTAKKRSAPALLGRAEHQGDLGGPFEPPHLL